MSRINLAEHDSDYVTLVTTVDTHMVGDAKWWFSEYRPIDPDNTWWQIGESEKDCACFFDEGEAWDYWNELIERDGHRWEKIK